MTYKQMSSLIQGNYYKLRQPVGNGICRYAEIEGKYLGCELDSGGARFFIFHTIGPNRYKRYIYEITMKSYSLQKLSKASVMMKML